MPQMHLKPGRERSVLRRHPWIFSGAIAHVEGVIAGGETVDVIDSLGKCIAQAAFSPDSQIKARIWTWDAYERVDREFFFQRLKQAISIRQSVFPSNITNAYRLVFGESDGLPGLIVDRYADELVVQILSAGAEHWRETILDSLLELTGLSRIYERSDLEVRLLEGLPLRNGLERGNQIPDKVQIYEHGLNYWVDICQGQKTGFYLDQRDNRVRLRGYTTDCEVLDCFCYTGGFALNALAGGANSVVVLESSGKALALGRENLILNNISSGRIEWCEADVFKQLRYYRDQGRQFDLIILDPPKFAPTTKQAHKAARGYKDINLLAFKLLRSGGILFTFSCSGGISAELFQQIISGAALDAGVEAYILEHLHQASDHPVNLCFPESDYLKGYVIKVVS